MKLFRLVLSLFLALASLFTFFVYAPNKALAVGQWAATGNMNIAHGQGDPVVALQNGKVLITGGSISTPGVDTNVSELYDPSTGLWTTTGSLGTARDSFSTPTVLNDGRVLIGSGSLGNPGVTTTSELYDPSTGQWSYTGNTNVVHTHAPAVKLSDGRVLVISGITDNNANDVTATSEIYDPSTGQWTLTGNVNNPIFDGTNKGGEAVLLNNGRVLKVGNRPFSNSTIAEIYDPSTGLWTTTGNLLLGRYITKLIKLQDGRVLMIGGDQWGNTVAECEIYDPSTGLWTTTGSMHYARSNNDALLLSDGRIFVAGGTDFQGNPVLQSEIYDPSTGTWAVDASLIAGQQLGSMAMLSTGKFLIADGTNQTAELYTPANNHAPVVGQVTISPNPVQINTSIAASANFTDADTGDTHTATWDWGDGTPTNPDITSGTVTESNGSGTVGADSHTYTATGVYTVTLTVTDNNGGTGTSIYQYVAVFDTNTSFAGGHSFNNPSGASPSTSGKVSFGVSAKYNNSNVLTGSAKMNFKAANLDFASTSLSSLATSNGKAYLKGSGTLNGNSGYTFLATGIDGSVVGGNDLIRFQIKDSSNNVVYDSQPGAGDTADPTTLDATGNIRVH